MSVKELIEKLQEMPQDLTVYLYVYGEEKEAEILELSYAFGCCDLCVEIS